MAKVFVKKHKWKGRLVPSYWRKKRPKGKKRIVGKAPIKLYPVTDEFGRRMGWSKKK